MKFSKNISNFLVCFLYIDNLGRAPLRCCHYFVSVRALLSVHMSSLISIFISKATKLNIASFTKYKNMYFDGSQQNFEFFVLSIDQKVKMVDTTGKLQQGKKNAFSETTG